MTEQATLFDVAPPAIAWPDRPRALVSYAYAKKLGPADFAAVADFDLIIDSGAFTAANSGKPIVNTDYVEWLLGADTGARFAFALDVIGDHEASTANWCEAVRLLDGAIRLVPTWHAGTPWPVLEAYCDATDYVAIGGCVPLYRDQVYLRAIATRAHQIAGRYGARLHGLGLTGRRVMREYPWASVDSSSWAICARLPYLYLANRAGRLVSHTYGRPFNPTQQDLIRRYGGDPDDGMTTEGWSLASVAGEELAAARKTWGMTASARAYMHVEATKPNRHDDGFRVHLATSPRELDLIRTAHQMHSPFTDTEGPTP